MHFRSLRAPYADFTQCPSTEHVFKVALPQLIEINGLLAPTTLPFDIPAIPKAMMENAVWYVTNQDTHV